MHIWLRFAVACVLLAASWIQTQDSARTGAPEQDPCADVQGQQPMNICSGQRYQQTDARLTVLYRQIADDLQSNNPIAANKLAAAQKAWVQYRDLHCDAAKYQFNGGSISPMIWADCMKLVTDHRIRELKAAYPVDGRERE